MYEIDAVLDYILMSTSDHIKRWDMGNAWLWAAMQAQQQFCMANRQPMVFDSRNNGALVPAKTQRGPATQTASKGHLRQGCQAHACVCRGVLGSHPRTTPHPLKCSMSCSAWPALAWRTTPTAIRLLRGLSAAWQTRSSQCYRSATRSDRWSWWRWTERAPRRCAPVLETASRPDGAVAVIP